MGGRYFHADAAQSVARYLSMQQRRHAVERQGRQAVIDDGRRAQAGAAPSAACTAKTASRRAPARRRPSAWRCRRAEVGRVRTNNPAACPHPAKLLLQLGDRRLGAEIGCWPHDPSAHAEIVLCAAALLPVRTNLALERAVLMIVDKRGERGFVQLLEHVGQPLRVGATGREARAIDAAQRLHFGVAVLAADLAVFVAVAIVQSGLCVRHGSGFPLMKRPGDREQSGVPHRGSRPLARALPCLRWWKKGVAGNFAALRTMRSRRRGTGNKTRLIPALTKPQACRWKCPRCGNAVPHVRHLWALGPRLPRG